MVHPPSNGLSQGAFRGTLQEINTLKAPPKPKDNSTHQAEYERDNRVQRPAVILPHKLIGQSPTAVIYDKSEGKFGPFANQMLIGEQTHSQVQRVFLEKVKGQYLGAVWHLLKGFRAGIVPAKMGEDGVLFAGGTNRGWASRGGKPFTFERVKWTGKTPFEMKEVKVTKDGFIISFTKELEEEAAKDPANYTMKAWTYQYRSAYGSKHNVNPYNPKVTKAVISKNKKSVRIYVDRLTKGHVHHIKISNKVVAAAGEMIWHSDVYYTLNELGDK